MYPVLLGMWRNWLRRNRLRICKPNGFCGFDSHHPHKLLYKDIIGLIVGFFLLIIIVVIMTKVLNQIKEMEEKNDGEFTSTSAARVIIGCITSIIFFIASMCCIF